MNPTKSPPPALGGVIYVTETGGGAGDGSSWDDAMCCVSAALASAASGDEVHVGAGTFVPAGDARNATFALPDGVALRGGFGSFACQQKVGHWLSPRPCEPSESSPCAQRQKSSPSLRLGCW